MDKLQLLLKENWELLQELFELPNKIDTKAYGDNFYNLKGEYGDYFDFHHTFTGNSGRTYKMVFKFNLRSVPHPVNEGGKGNIHVDDKYAPIYEVSFYPVDEEGKASQWKLLNDIDPTKAITVAGYFILYHASQLATKSVPVPFIKYLFRPFKEETEKQKDAKSSKRGLFYNRAVPRVIDALSSNFKDIKITEVKPEAEYTLISVNLASH